MSITVKDANGVNRTVLTTDDLVPIVNLIGTRSYNYTGIQRIPVAASAANSDAIAATEVMLYSNVKCYFRIGGTATATTAIPLEAGEKFHIRIATGSLISVIRDSSDGFLYIIPVA